MVMIDDDKKKYLEENIVLQNIFVTLLWSYTSL